MQYFTSDWHFFGEGFLKNEKRSHFSNVHEMNQAIIDGIFNTLKAGDDLYFLGDIGWKFPEGWLDSFFFFLKKNRIKMFWINGNHDYKIKSPQCSSLLWRGDMKTIKVRQETGSQKIILCHYPMHVWDSSHYNSWSLYGHIHFKDSTWNRLMIIPITGKTLNVNCELHNFRPLSFEEVKLNMTLLRDNIDLIGREDTYGTL